MLRRYKDQVLIIAMGILLFLPFLGTAHLFDWDEINFAEISREMLATGNFTQTQVEFQQFWEKPPFFFWLQSASMSVFGMNAFGARFPDALCGIITLLILFSIGKQLKNRKFGWLWVAFYACSVLPQFYFKSGLIDPWFNLFIFLSIYYFIRYQQQSHAMRSIFYSALYAGLAILTKGPVGLLIIGLSFLVYFISVRFKYFPPLTHILIFIVSVALPVLPWITIEIAQNGTWFITEFFKYQLRLATTEDASHGGFPGYHVVVLFIFCFPASAFAIRSFFKKQNTTQELLDFRKWMIIVFLVVLILFEMIKTKIAHYSSMAYFPLTFLAAYTVSNLELQWRRSETILLMISGSVFCIFAIAIPFLFLHTNLIVPYIHDSFTLQALSADGNWNLWDSAVGVLMLAGLIAAIIYNSRKKMNEALVILFLVCGLGINLITIIYTPKIERYSQGAMVDFFIDKQNENCYSSVIGFKSYAQLFYGRRKEEDEKNPVFMEWLSNQHPAQQYSPLEYRKYYNEWLLSGDVDKPVYLVTNSRKKDQFAKMPQLEITGEKNGFVFFKRISAQ